MILFPAIDLDGGRVVRLEGGDFDRPTDYGGDPLETARRFRDCGATHLHVVDLQGAREGAPRHLKVLERLGDLGFFLQFGGGLRTPEAIRAALDAGADRVLVGSLLFRDPDQPARLRETFGEALVPAVDVKGGRVAVSGWRETTGRTPEETLVDLALAGYGRFFVTAVDRDGLLGGPDLDLYRTLAKRHRIVAAGGVSGLGDLLALRDLGVEAAVAGRALYEGRLDLPRALEALEGSDVW